MYVCVSHTIFNILPGASITIKKINNEYYRGRSIRMIRSCEAWVPHVP